MAIAYEDGVAIINDKVVSYGKSARYMNVSRQYRVNKNSLVAFGGDHADFQTLQNIIERRQNELRAHDRESILYPKQLFSYLSTLLYYRRCKMNPMWNTLIVCGMQPEQFDHTKLSPFIGVITPKGVAYEAKHVATGLSAMLLNQVIETEYRSKTMTKDEAIACLKKAHELTIYHDCVASNVYELAVVDKEDVHLSKSETITGNWLIAEYNCQYE